MKRRTMVAGLTTAVAAPTGAVTGAVGSAGTASAADQHRATGSGAAASDPLAFDPDAFTVLSATVPTEDGDREVTYRFYRAVTYVARPVDATYQCLNVSVPVEIDGRPVDASDAPILLNNSIGGYMSSSVADATGVGGGGPGGPGGPGGQAGNAALALAAGHVVVDPGARGRDLVDPAGTYYGVAPAAIVDLKAAVRYVRHNRGRLPGNPERIVSTGVSAGGALSALLGASGDSPLYAPYLRELGAARAGDAIFGAAAYCPIADLEHADMAYEWMWGDNPLDSGGEVDRAVSRELRAAFADYQASLGLRGKNGSGRLTARNYDEHLLETYLRPAATRYLRALPEADRTDYLAGNPWITWSGGRAAFGWRDFLTHVGARKKNTPAFDPFDLTSPENNEFGAGTTEARHFTLYSLRRATGNASARLDRDLPAKLGLMNPMHFVTGANRGRARRWWIRVGTHDTDTSHTVVGNLAAGLTDLGDDVNASMYWDAGHGANEDAPDFIRWIARVTGHEG